MSDLQKDLDERFPFGGAVTRIEDVVEGIGFDDSTQFLTSRLVVLKDEDPPMIQMLVLGVDMDVRLELHGTEETSPGVVLLKTPEDEPDYLVTMNVTDDVKETLRQFRAEEYGEDV